MGWVKGIWNIVNSKLFLLILSIFLTSFSGTMVKKWNEAKDDAKRWENNYSISIKSSDTLRDKNGMLITRTKTLEMTIQELKRTNDSSILNLLDKLRESQIRVKQVDKMIGLNQAYAKEMQLEVLNKDSLIRILQAPVELNEKETPLLVGKYIDEFTSANILYYGGKWQLEYKCVNEAYGVLYHQREKIKLLFFNLRIGKKNYWFDYKETNPSISTDIKILSVERKKQ
ncbi:MAG: hypothetical protein JXR64_03010 [Spirochaetales bacterium]|nr:hypothetical protein [Spirochaetales bacterium]